MIPIVGLASGMGAGNEGCRHGPAAIQEQCKLAADWKKMIHMKQGVNNKRDHIALLNQELAETTYNLAMKYPFTLVIGGDHSCGIGTWSGISEAYRQQGEDLALIWVDAHLDSHTPETSESGNIHGMPVAALLGKGDPKLTQLLSENSKIKTENLFFVGIRSFEAPEKELVERLNIRVYYIEEVTERGLKAVITEILSILAQRKVKYGISVDIDAFDPSRMTATGTPVENGLDPDEFIELYALFGANPPVAFEFVEFNPSRDTNGESLRLIQKMLQRVIEVQNASIQVAVNPV